jgi:methionyl-tRNA formyltransferase
MRAVFMGTPDAAVPSLRGLDQACEVVSVYTRPDRPRGRGRRMESSPVKAAAVGLGLEVVEAAGLRGEDQRLAVLRPDVVCVVAYGVILPPEVLEVPPLGCVNVHFSLLPRWRGAAPVERSILSGDERTGVVTMLMDEGLDTGPVLRSKEVAIGPHDTTGDLRLKLAELGAGLLVETIADLSHITPVVQDESKATYAHRIQPADAVLDPSEPAEMLERRVRAMSPKPGDFLEFRG